MRRIAVLTSGGDAPGMNAATRAVVRSGVLCGFEMLAAALARMHRHGARRIQVDDGGAILGVVTLDDLLKLRVERAAALLDVITTEQIRESRTRR